MAKNSGRVPWYVYPLIILVAAFFYFLGSIATAVPAMVVSFFGELF